MIDLLLGIIGLALCLVPPAVVLIFALWWEGGSVPRYHSSQTHRMLETHIGNHTLDQYNSERIHL